MCLGIPVIPFEVGIDIICSLDCLDIMLPGMDGFAVRSKIREQANTPIIIVSAKEGKEVTVRTKELEKNPKKSERILTV